MKLFLLAVLVGIILAQQLQCPPGFSLVKKSGSQSAPVPSSNQASWQSSGPWSPWWGGRSFGSPSWGNKANTWGQGYGGNTYGQPYAQGQWGAASSSVTSSNNGTTASSTTGTVTNSSSAPQVFTTVRKSTPSNITIDQVNSATNVNTLYEANTNVKASRKVELREVGNTDNVTVYTFMKEVEKIINGERTVEISQYKVYDFDNAKGMTKGNLTDQYNCMSGNAEVAKPEVVKMVETTTVSSPT
jgi:hypothetical protein